MYMIIKKLQVGNKIKNTKGKASHKEIQWRHGHQEHNSNKLKKNKRKNMANI